MTTKQIAEAVGKTERSVRNWVKKAAEKSSVVAEKMATSSPMKPADYNLEETCKIIESGMGKNAADLYRMSASKPISVLESTDDELDRSFKAAVTGIFAMVQNLDTRMSNIETKIEKRQELLPPPEIEPKNQITRLVRKESASSNRPYSHVWNELYEEFGYRFHCNPRISARNRRMSIIDFIETEGQIHELLSVAIEVFGA